MSEKVVITRTSKRTINRGLCLVESIDHIQNEAGVLVGRNLINFGPEDIPLLVAILSESAVEINEGTVMAKLQEIEDVISSSKGKEFSLNTR